jgi:hypothetical protein
MDKKLSNDQFNELVTINLTVKEALALIGEKFNYDHKLLIDTRRKIHNAAYKKINSKLEDGDKK